MVVGLKSRRLRQLIALNAFIAFFPLLLFAQQYRAGEVIVKLKSKSSKSLHSQAFIGKAITEKQMTLKGSWSGLNTHYFALKPGQDVQDAIRDLQADPDVEYAEPNFILEKQSVDASGDVMAQAAACSNTSQTGAAIQLSQAWSAMSSNSNLPVVAVIDTGVDYNHSKFTAINAIWTNTNEIAGNGIDDDHNGYVDDVRGWNFAYNNNTPMDDDSHGTHVAGIILGTTQNFLGSSPVTTKVKIMPLKFLDSSGSGNTSDAVNAIYYAVNNGAQVLNNSWGGGGFSNSLLQAIAYAYDKKAVFVAASGNSTNNNDVSPTYPANYNVPSVISVAATYDWDSLASFSNYGATTVHMASPGVSVYSTLPNSTCGYSSGTSMATPFVSGVAALILREQPTMTGYQIKNLIFASDNSVSALNGKVSEKSRLNALNSVNNAKVATVSTSQPTYNASSYLRSTASADAQQVAPPGCGLLAKKLYDDMGDSDDNPGSPLKHISFLGLLAILMAPVLLISYLKNREGRNRRQHDRYRIQSEVKLRVGDRDLVGSISTISMGGVQLNTDALLEKGGIVKMNISSPDGKDVIQVEGQIVWSEEHKHYGVQFAETTEGIRSSIAQWTQGLSKAS